MAIESRRVWPARIRLRSVSICVDLWLELHNTPTDPTTTDGSFSHLLRNSACSYFRHHESHDDVEDWLNSLTLSDTSKNNYRSRLFSLFAYGVKKHFLDRNPASDIEQIKVLDKAPVILSVEELSALLDHASPEVLPLLAISSFAGVRTEELMRLSWDEVNVARGFIEIKTAKSKTSRRRLIPMQPNLVAWLSLFKGKTGPLWQGDIHEKLFDQFGLAMNLTEPRQQKILTEICTKKEIKLKSLSKVRCSNLFKTGSPVLHKSLRNFT
jgi:site-specific recombinase XerD